MRRFAIVFVLLAGCMARPQAAPPLATTGITTAVAQYAGSVISGPTTAPADLKAGIEIVHVRWIALAKMPDVAATSLGSRARLIVAGNTDAPLLGSPGLTAEVKLVENEPAVSLAKAFAGAPTPAQALVAEQTSALFRDAASVFSTDVAGSASPRQSVELRIARSTTIGPTSRPMAPLYHCSLTLARNDAFATSNAAPLQSETALFDFRMPNSNDAVVLLIPMRFGDPHAKVLAASIAVGLPTSSAEDTATIAKSEADLQQSYQSLASRSGMLPIGISQSAGISSALRALRVPDQQRAALIYLANETSARLAEDIALVADNSILYQLSQKFLTASGNVPADALPALGWVLDRSGFELLASLAGSPDGSKLPPELATVLTQFAGEAARHSASLDEITHGMSNETDLQNRIIAQNLVFLTDSSPASRVRAFDWLNSRHLAPAGYDPLGPGRDRRLAIDRATTQP